MPKAATDVFASGGWVANPEPKAEESLLKVSVSAYDDKTATVKMPDGAEQQLPREDISPANPEELTTQDNRRSSTSPRRRSSRTRGSASRRTRSTR